MAQTTAPTAFAENGVSLPVGGEPIASVQSLTVTIQNVAAQTVETDAYYDLTTNHLGSGSA
jgi:hypothetical protein